MGVDSLNLVHDKTQLWTFLNTVMNFPSSLKGGEFHDQPRDHILHKEDPASWNSWFILRSTIKRTFRPEQTGWYYLKLQFINNSWYKLQSISADWWRTDAPEADTWQLTDSSGSSQAPVPTWHRLADLVNRHSIGPDIRASGLVEVFMFILAMRPPMGVRISFPEGKEAVAWIWPLASIECGGLECVHFPPYSLKLETACRIQCSGWLRTELVFYNTLKNIFEVRQGPKFFKHNFYTTATHLLKHFKCN